MVTYKAETKSYNVGIKFKSGDIKYFDNVEHAHFENCFYCLHFAVYPEKIVLISSDEISNIMLTGVKEETE